MHIGILGLQGAFAEHEAMLGTFPGVTTSVLRQRADLSTRLDGLIIPGGESTVMAKLLVELGMMDLLLPLVENGLPVFGTCAGLILLAKRVEGRSAARLGQLDVTVRRNAYGRQLDSFTARSAFAGMPDVPMVFIRAPSIREYGQGVTPLATVDGIVVAVRQGPILGTAFHPELTRDCRVHGYFLDMVREYGYISGSDSGSPISA